MSRRPPILALSLLLPACADDPALEPEDATCPRTEPVRLAAAPDGFTPAADTDYDLQIVGDHILYSFDAADAPDRTYWHMSRCGGDSEEFPSLPPGMRLYTAAVTDRGPVLYATDPEGKVFVVDRLDVPGFDAPREVPGLPPRADPTDVAWSGIHDGAPPFAAFFRRPLGSGARSGAAGIGSGDTILHIHTGDPDLPAVEISDTLVRSRVVDHRLFLHEDDGTARWVDPVTGESTPVRTGVRHASLSPDARRLIWQALGDDKAEPVYLHDLETGAERQLATNDFAQFSWISDPELGPFPIGTWAWTDSGAFAAMIGPGGSGVAAVRADTGEPLEIPPHESIVGTLANHFRLTLPDPSEHVDAIWGPATGALFEWYRGPSAPIELRQEGGFVEFIIPGTDGALTGPLVRVDLATGQTEQRLPRLTWPGSWLADDTYLLMEHRDQVATAAGSLHGSTFTYDLTFADAKASRYTPGAGRVFHPRWLPEQGLLYLDAHGENPGVWAVPLP